MEKQTLGEKTAQMLLEMIQKEGFGPGDKLPTEAELVESLGVGRNTVREAAAHTDVQKYCHYPSGIRNLYFWKKKALWMIRWVFP